MITRRNVVLGATATLALSLVDRRRAWAEQKRVLAYFGTYTGGKSKGIYVAEFDTETGRLGEPKLAIEALQPSFLALHSNGKYLYSCNETSDFQGKKSGALTAYAIGDNGTLKALNQQPSIGAGPCHLVVDRAGKNVLAANYGGGSVCAYALESDGSLGKNTAFVQHKGKRTHAHSINVDKNNRFALAADLGLDQVIIYKFDEATGSLMQHGIGELPTGGGPRHLALHPTGKYVYVNNETLSSVTAFAYDGEKGTLTSLNTTSTLPQPTPGNSTAEVAVHPSGKFVYVSNRGHNSIAVFKVDEATGKLSAAGHQTQGIKIPRNFGIDPSGKWAIVCNQDGHDVIVFRINQESGALDPMEHRVEVGSPVCVKFLVG